MSSWGNSPTTAVLAAVLIGLPSNNLSSTARKKKCNNNHIRIFQCRDLKLNFKKLSKIHTELTNSSHWLRQPSRLRKILQNAVWCESCSIPYLKWTGFIRALLHFDEMIMFWNIKYYDVFIYSLTQWIFLVLMYESYHILLLIFLNHPFNKHAWCMKSSP